MAREDMASENLAQAKMRPVPIPTRTSTPFWDAAKRGKFLLRDNEKNQVVAERLLQPLFCLRAGKRYDADASILPEAIAA